MLLMAHTSTHEFLKETFQQEKDPEQQATLTEKQVSSRPSHRISGHAINVREKIVTHNNSQQRRDIVRELDVVSLIPSICHDRGEGCDRKDWTKYAEYDLADEWMWRTKRGL